MRKHGIMMDPVEGFDNDEGENTLTDKERENICRNLEELNKEKAAKEAQESQRKIDRIKELMKKCGMTPFPVDYEEAFQRNKAMKKKPVINVDEVMKSMAESLRKKKQPEYAVDHEMGSTMTKEEIAEFHRKLKALNEKWKKRREAGFANEESIMNKQ